MHRTVCRLPVAHSSTGGQQIPSLYQRHNLHAVHPRPFPRLHNTKRGGAPGAIVMASLGSVPERPVGHPVVQPVSSAMSFVQPVVPVKPSATQPHSHVLIPSTRRASACPQPRYPPAPLFNTTPHPSPGTRAHTSPSGPEELHTCCSLAPFPGRTRQQNSPAGAGRQTITTTTRPPLHALGEWHMRWVAARKDLWSNPTNSSQRHLRRCDGRADPQLKVGHGT